MVNELRCYVEHETPTHRKEAVDKLGHFIEARFVELGCRVRRIEQPDYGDQLVIEYGKSGDQILVLGHFDTVKEIGTLAREPWRVEGDKIFGPGTYDMKAGIVASYYALKAIIDNNLPLTKKLVFFWNTDEEMGSESSTAYIEEYARDSKCVLVVEPTHGSGALKTSRKSGGEFRIAVRGRAAHAGNDHQLGVNAIEELAHHVLQVQSWTDYTKGTTLSVGLIQGGSASNVVPDSAEAVVDVRVSLQSEGENITQKMYALKPINPNARLQVSGAIKKPPFERTNEVAELFHVAQREAELEGFGVTEAGVGGMSDGNTAARVCPAVLDGLGPVGDGAHAVHEHILKSEMPKRTALLLRLLLAL